MDKLESLLSISSPIPNIIAGEDRLYLNCSENVSSVPLPPSDDATPSTPSKVRVSAMEFSWNVFGTQ